MTWWMITRVDFDNMENNYAAALRQRDIGIVPNEDVADLLIQKYEKATASFRYYGWGDSLKQYPYPSFHKTALCQLSAKLLLEDYDCASRGEHAPVAAFGICLSCGMNVFEMKKQEDERIE